MNHKKVLLKLNEAQNNEFELYENTELEDFKNFLCWIGNTEFNFIDIDNDIINVVNEDDFNYFKAYIFDLKFNSKIKISNKIFRILQIIDIDIEEEIKEKEIVNNELDNLNYTKISKINEEEEISEIQNNLNSIENNSNSNNEVSPNINHSLRERTLINKNNSFHNLTVRNNNDINNTFNHNSKHEKLKNLESEKDLEKIFENENKNYNFEEILNENLNIEEIINNRIQKFLSNQIPKLITDIRKNYIEYENKNNFLYENLNCLNCSNLIGKDIYYGCYECENFFLCKNCELENNHIHCMVKIKCLDQHKDYLKKINKFKNEEILKETNISQVSMNSVIKKDNNYLKNIINDKTKKESFKYLVEVFGKQKMNDIIDIMEKNPESTLEELISLLI